MSTMPSLAWADGPPPVSPASGVCRFKRHKVKNLVWFLEDVRVHYVHKHPKQNTVPCVDPKHTPDGVCPFCSMAEFDRRYEGWASALLLTDKARDSWDPIVAVLTKNAVDQLGKPPHRGVLAEIWRAMSGNSPRLYAKRMDKIIVPPIPAFDIEAEMKRLWFPDQRTLMPKYPEPVTFQVPKYKPEIATPLGLTDSEMQSACERANIFSGMSDENLIDKYVRDVVQHGLDSIWVQPTRTELDKRQLLGAANDLIADTQKPKLFEPRSAAIPMSQALPTPPTVSSPAEPGILDRLRRQQEQQPPVQAPPTMDEGLEFLKRVQAGTRVERLVVEESIADFEALASRRTGEILCSDQKKKMSADHPANTNGKHKREDVA